MPATQPSDDTTTQEERKIEGLLGDLRAARIGEQGTRDRIEEHTETLLLDDTFRQLNRAREDQAAMKARVKDLEGQIRTLAVEEAMEDINPPKGVTITRSKTFRFLADRDTEESRREWVLSNSPLCLTIDGSDVSAAVHRLMFHGETIPLSIDESRLLDIVPALTKEEREQIGAVDVVALKASIAKKL